MTLLIESKHQQIVSTLLDPYDFSFFAFGSRVTGKNKKFSDLDLFYTEEMPRSIFLALEEAFEESDLPFKVDIVNFKQCDPTFQRIMLKNYICLKASTKLKTIEQNHLWHFAYLPKKLAQKINIDVHEINDVTIINCGLKTSMFNIAYGALKISDSSVDEIKKAFRGQPFAWWIPPSQHNPEVTQALIKNGFIIEKIEHAMICDLNNVASFEQKTDLMIKPVENSAMLADFISVLEFYDPYVSALYGCINNELLLAAEKLVVGYAGSKPVSVGVLFVSGDSSGIFSIVTSGNFQGKGYGTDMMVFLMKFARESGCNSVTLSTSSDSRYQIYECLGFSKIGEFECFARGNHA